MELTLRSEDKTKDKSIASELGELNFHIFVDQTFFGRIDNIKNYFPTFMSDADIDAMGLSVVRTRMLKQAMNAIAFVWFHAAHGQGADRPDLLKKAYAASELTEIVTDDILHSSISDEDLEELDMEAIGKLKKVVLAAFNKENSTVMKGFVYQGAPNAPKKETTGPPTA